MALNAEILVLAARNMASPSGEWRLIARRAEALWLESGVRTVVYALTRADRLTAARDMPTTDGMDVIHFKYGGMVGLPAAMARMMSSVRTYLANSDPCAIVLSGLPTYALAPVLRRSGVPMFVDVHGPLEEWLDYRPKFIGPAALVPVLYTTAKLLEKVAMRISTGALVVSHPLALYVQKQYHVKQVFIIPCGVVARGPFGDLESARRRWRQRLGLTKETVVVYSGGLSRWQLIDKACDLFKSIRGVKPDSELLLMTPDVQQARHVAQRAGIPGQDAKCVFLPAAEVGEALAACDVGVLLREANITNQMAFPNKFAEYLRAGLVVVTSPGLKEPSVIVTEHEVGVSIRPDQVEDQEALGPLVELIRTRANNLRSYYKRCESAFEEHLEMRAAVRPFAEAIGCGQQG